MDNTIEKVDYFANRNVSDASYKNFSPPAYFISILPSSRESRILDIGCGLGQFMEYFKNLGYQSVHGIDISDEAIKSCRLKNLNVTRIDDIRDFLVPADQKFDFIIMNHVIEHIPKELIIKTLTYIKKELLSEEGKLFIATPNAQAITGSYWRYEDFTHSTIFTAGSLFYVLTAAGFKQTTIIDADGLAGSQGLKKVFKRMLLRVFKSALKIFFMITGGAYHQPSPDVYTWEIKVIGR